MSSVFPFRNDAIFGILTHMFNRYYLFLFYLELIGKGGTTVTEQQ